MSNILEFFIRMRDHTRAGLTSAVSNTQSSTTRMQRAIDNVSAANRRMGSSFDGVSGHIRQTNREMQELQRTAQRVSGSGGGFNIKSLLKYAGGAYAAKQALGFGVSSIKSAMEFGMTEKSFGVLTGSADKGKALAGELNQLQQNTILGPEVFKAAQTMMAFGVQTEKVIKFERELGDVAMGNRDKFEALTLARSQTTAAGKLMGQDLLQYINAGFNPLQVMSEQWEKFGLTSKKSVGELKEMMEKGQISAAAVDKAFEVATGAGGKFAGMMEQMAETSGGKLQILEGQYENFKIQVGNALMPVAESLMGVANKTLDWLNISKSVPQQLYEEHASIITLVDSITSLNEGNSTRHDLLEKLKKSYPDLFGFINSETVKNAELLKSLQDVNEQYDRRIQLAAHDVMINDAKTNYKEAQGQADRYNILATLARQGNVDKAENMMTLAEKTQMLTNAVNHSPAGFNYMASLFQNQADNFHGKQIGEESRKKNDDVVATWEQVKKLTNDMEYQTKQFGGDQKKIAAFYGEYAKLSTFIAKDPHGIYDYDFTNMKSAIGGKLSDISSDKPTKEKQSIGATRAAQGITGGGQRTININGVKFADKIEIHQATGKESVAELEKILTEMYFRVLNSGAKIN